MSRRLSLLFGGVLFVLPGCQLFPFGVPGTPEAPSLILDPAQVILHIPSDTQENLLNPTALRVSVTEVHGGRVQERAAGLHWESADPAIATVTSDGTVSAVAPGRTVVTARAGDNPSLASTASVTVKDGGQAHVVVE